MQFYWEDEKKCVCVGGNYIFKNSEELKELVVVISGEGKEGL